MDVMDMVVVGIWIFYFTTSPIAVKCNFHLADSTEISGLYCSCTPIHSVYSPSCLTLCDTEWHQRQLELVGEATKPALIITPPAGRQRIHSYSTAPVGPVGCFQFRSNAKYISNITSYKRTHWCPVAVFYNYKVFVMFHWNYTQYDL